MSNTDKHWERWAALDPYHGVLGRGFGVGDIEQPETRERFFAQGEEHIARVLSQAATLGLTGSGAALDFGCGVGRLLDPLLARFDHVTGVDVSSSMLALARENCSDSDRLDLVQSLDEVRLGVTSFNLVHSFIVLQHIKLKRGLAFMRQMLDLTKPGGIAAFHFTVGDLDTRRRALNILRYRIPPLHWLYNVSTGRHWNLPISEMNPYPMPQVLAMLRTIGSDRFVGWSVNQGGHQGMMLIVAKPLDS